MNLYLLIGSKNHNFARENDLTVNALKGEQLTNVRSSGTDAAQNLVPPIVMLLKQVLKFIDNDKVIIINNASMRLGFLMNNDETKNNGSFRDMNPLSTAYCAL